jgi:hypothetical protein
MGKISLEQFLNLFRDSDAGWNLATGGAGGLVIVLLYLLGTNPDSWHWRATTAVSGVARMLGFRMRAAVKVYRADSPRFTTITNGSAEECLFGYRANRKPRKTPFASR